MQNVFFSTAQCNNMFYYYAHTNSNITHAHLNNSTLLFKQQLILKALTHFNISNYFNAHSVQHSNSKYSIVIAVIKKANVINTVYYNNLHISTQQQYVAMLKQQHAQQLANFNNAKKLYASCTLNFANNSCNKCVAHNLCYLKHLRSIKNIKASKHNKALIRKKKQATACLKVAQQQILKQANFYAS